MLASVRVRRAESSDAEALAEIVAAVAEEGLIATEPPVDVSARAERIRTTMEDGTAARWVLEDGGSVVGSSGLEETRVAGVLSLGIAILPSARGRGGGRALLEAMLEDAGANGAHKIELEVWPENARAIAFYERAGFEPEGLRRNHYRRRDGSLRSALLMARAVEPRGEER